MVDNKNAKRICIAIHGLAHAGAERVATSWANFLAKQGHAVFILVYACSEDNYELEDRVRVIPLAQTRETYFQMSKLRQIMKTRKIIKKEKPEIIISFLPKMQITMMLATLGLRVKRIETIRNNPWIDKDVHGKRFLWNLCFQRSDAIIVQTKEQSLYFSEKLQRKSVVICNPISKDLLDKQKQYGEKGVCKFVAVARINAQKNYPMMIRAFSEAAKKNSVITLDIYGTGTPLAVQEQKRLIEEVGMHDRIQLCGWRRDIFDVLLSHDAFLMSSDYEGMPNALAEAMASGLVCLSTDCKTGPKDMIDHGINGYLAATGDARSFAEGIQTIMEMDSEQCMIMGKAAKEKILEMCSEENTLVRLKRLIESEL